MQCVALMIEELNAVAYAALVGFAHGESAGPLVEEKTQIQLTRIEDQPGMTVQVLVAITTHLLMHRVAITGNGFGDAYLFEFGQQGTGIGLQTTGVLTDAGVGQLRFADAKNFSQVTRIFAWVINFCLLVACI
ncbi:hypothetical protein D3C73_877320 [compost metagenome]